MATDIDLRELSSLMAQDCAFLSIYISRPKELDGLAKRFRKVRKVLKSGSGGKDEKEYFDQNVKVVEEYLTRNPLTSGGLCLFSCWVLDFFKAIPLSMPVEDLVHVDSSPFIRPLAEFQDEYENVAVVVVDNKKARVFFVSSAVADQEEIIVGNVKNHVKKGGWSQQRYERKRDKQLLLYSKEIVKVLHTLEEQEHFRRIVLVGSKETIRVIQENIPKAMREKIISRAVDLSKSEGDLNKEILDLLMEKERRSEKDLWEYIRNEYLKNGLGIVGLSSVLEAAKEGRVEKLIVERDFKPAGQRCRDCEDLHIGILAECPKCNSKSLFEVDMVNEIVEFLNLSSAEVDFSDPIETLTEAGRIAALIRYKR